MKLLLTTIAAVLVVGCGDPTMLLPGGGKSIYRAASEGKTEDVKQYLAAGTDVNAKDRHGNTPLIYAETKKMIELLVTSGADVNVRDWRGRTLLHKASKRKWGDRETV
ncbi:MAG: ankyrin repeat domain-containing protein, partial [Planctomycetota bacterium]|nr:ankyrin repeat domain-containing protein [Planctomycetota bacterium]